MAHNLSSFSRSTLLLLAILVLACGGRSETRTYEGKLMGLKFEHRNVVEYKGDAGPQVSLLVTAGHPRGTLAEDGIKLFYRADADSFLSIPMKSGTSGRRYVAEIPHQKSGKKVQYYIEVTYREGKRLTFPSTADSGEYYTIRIQ